MKRTGILLLLALLAVTSCGPARRTPSARKPEAAVIPPLTDSADIARSRARAQAVMDSIDRVRSGASAPRERISDKKAVQAAPKALVDDLLDYARTFLGVPYRLGATGPAQFDCSGFTRYVFQEFGYDLPKNSNAQFKACRPVESFSELRKGDLVFFGARGSIRDVGHVGIVTDVDLERGMFHFIHASTSNGVEIQRSTHPYFMMRYMGAGRLLPD